MLMLCLGIGSPETATLYVFKDCCDPTLQILDCEPGDVGLFPKPCLLPLGEAARGLDRLTCSSLERPFPPHMEHELAIADGLEGGEARVQPSTEQRFHLPHPALFQHPGHAACDFIV